MSVSQIPRERTFDSTLALLAEGNTFIATRCQRYRSDTFATRLMLQRAICIQGEDAARLFYTPDLFTRRGALPPMALLLLQDFGSVAMLDGEAHRRRKRLFMGLMTPSSIQALVDRARDAWRAHVAVWEHQARVPLDTAVQGVLTRAVCAWAGLALTEAEAERRTREFGAMFDGAGSVGPRNWRGLLLRRRTERWARQMIRAARARTLAVPEESPVALLARHRDEAGRLLATSDAAVELINLLRPTVAVSRFITFAALALHAYPDCRRRLEDGGLQDEYLEWFVQEVRRFFPFFPFVGGRALQPFAWRGERFERGAWFILDQYGTNHDPRTWEEPDHFRPERFRLWDRSPFNFLPQGGGAEYETTHRCAGEWLTIALMKEAVRLLVVEMRYTVPHQDLRIDLSRMPAVPRSRFVLEHVRRAP